MGLDNGIVRIADGRVMAVTTDPLSYIPELGPEDSAWISVHLLANDLSTSGLEPAYAILSFNVPEHIHERDFERYWRALHQELKKLNIAVIAGHTGRYGGDHSTIIGNGTLIATGSESAYLSSSMAMSGDQIILTKGAMPGTCGLLARVFPKSVESAYGAEFLKRAQKLFGQYPTTPDALASMSVGVKNDGVTAMHDVTEGGVYGALDELVSASSCGLAFDKAEIFISDEVRAICELFELDPYRSLSEGALLVSVRPHKTGEVLKALYSKKINASIVGELRAKSHGISIEPSVEDPYWKAYQRAHEKGWK
jgi:hydrogenase maturation factor